MLLKFKVKVFLSYSILDKKFAECLVRELKHYPFIDIFMAPKDIKAGTFWIDELKFNLKNSDVLLALLTKNYHNSDWTEQEIGLASTNSSLSLIDGYRSMAKSERCPELNFIGKSLI